MIENEITDHRGDFLEYSRETHSGLLRIRGESGPTPAVRHLTWWAAQEMHRIREAVSNFDHDRVMVAMDRKAKAIAERARTSSAKFVALPDSEQLEEERRFETSEKGRDR